MIEQNSGHIKFDCGANIEEFDEQKLLNNIDNLNIKDHQGSHLLLTVFMLICGTKLEVLVRNLTQTVSDPDFNMKLWNEGVKFLKV